MSLLLRGVARLSQLEIDADKDWQAKEITNLKTIAGAIMEILPFVARVFLRSLWQTRARATAS